MWAPAKGIPLQQQNLPAAALLGRRAHHPHCEPEVVGRCGQGETDADGGGRDHVVPAGVPDAGKRIILRADHDVQRP